MAPVTEAEMATYKDIDFDVADFQNDLATNKLITNGDKVGASLNLAGFRRDFGGPRAPKKNHIGTLRPQTSNFEVMVSVNANVFQCLSTQGQYELCSCPLQHHPQK